MGEALGTIALSTALPSDDSGRVRDIGCLSVDREPQPARKLESYLVHGVVQRCARWNHGSTSSGKPGADSTSLG